ncbi:hypothetical protein [Agrobacterium tumefaciens]|uniref:hypothetical protein n=1 Tax=Agrobacterium tumefaciens TaxID=358 RepID=UPI00287E3685|nr:hypothetical protein [Agrobacterium tumefaciens]MDS7594926.1 hypothetical protein [Agrobacterium tumefaciens]
MKRLVVFFSVVFALGVAAFIGFLPDPDRFRHNIPCGIEVERSGFAVSDYTGIGGPGDFFAIFAVFDLTESNSEQIKKGGTPFLEGLRCEKAATPHQEWPRDYFSWRETPILLKSRFNAKAFESISEYLSQREIDLSIAPEILTASENALSSKGNFVGQQNNGFLLIVPDQRRAYYFYSN